MLFQSCGLRKTKVTWSANPGRPGSADPLSQNKAVTARQRAEKLDGLVCFEGIFYARWEFKKRNRNQKKPKKTIHILQGTGITCKFLLHRKITCK